MRSALSLLLLAVTVSCAQADVTATFLGDAVYGWKSDCAKLAKIARGGPRNIQTSPELLSATGYQGWEGGCTIAKISARASVGRWRVDLICHEGAEDNMKRTEIWTKRGDVLTVTHDGKSETYERCQVAPPRRKN